MLLLELVSDELFDVLTVVVVPSLLVIVCSVALFFGTATSRPLTVRCVSVELLPVEVLEKSVVLLDELPGATEELVGVFKCSGDGVLAGGSVLESV